MENPHPLATRKRKELIKDKKSYIDSVAKEDIGILNNQLESGMGKSAVRLFIGASEAIPTRALSYLASAARVTEMLGAEQLQVVSVNTLGSQINNVSSERVRQQFMQFAHLGQHILSKVIPAVADKISFAEDTAATLDRIVSLTPVVGKMLQNNRALNDKLANRSSKHGGDFAAYTAAHSVYQDLGGLGLCRLIGAELIEPEYTVAVGCLQEKIFFEARQRIRETIPDEVVPSVQIFSLHASAPYFVANGGEQLLDEAAVTRRIEFTNPNPATNRDLSHLQLVLNGGTPHER